MDIDMPGMNGIGSTAVVKAISPSIQVVMLTVSEKEDRIFQALRNGATGYMLKKSGRDELVNGPSYKMIAAKHFISTDTVKTHIQGIYRKLHVNSKGEAISLALKRGIAVNRL